MVRPEAFVLALSTVLPSLLYSQPTFTLTIPPDTMACGVFSVWAEPREVYETKTVARFAQGVFELPTNRSWFEANLFEEVRFGAQQELMKPANFGFFRVLRIPPKAGERAYRFSYEHIFTLPGGERFLIRLFALDFQWRSKTPITKTLVLDEEFLTFELSMEGLLEGLLVTSYSSCSYGLLPLWETRVELEGGSSLSLKERFLPHERPITTGPASLVRADLNVAGHEQTVTDYWRLVYTAERHDRNVRYWVVLDPPLKLGNVAGRVHVVEVAAPEPSDGILAQVSYLGADFAVLSQPGVSLYERTQGPFERRFIRGDVDATGGVSITDAVVLLGFMFQGGAQPECLKAADANDDGRLSVTDAIGIVALLFRDTGPLPEPSACGLDPTVDEVSCDDSTCQYSSVGLRDVGVRVCLGTT